MKRSNAIAAIDIGATKVTALVADVNEYRQPRLLGVGVAPAAGLSRGVIDNIQSARNAVATAVEKAEQSCGMRILSGVVGIGGGHLSSQNNRGIVAIADRTEPITSDDRARAIEVAGQISIPSNRQILHVIPRGYWIEGTDPVSDPVGMYGARLDAETHIVTAAVSAVRNLTKCVEDAGVQIDEVVLSSLAAATGALTAEERAQGVAAVDIGGSTTSICVYDEGAVAHTATLSLGGTHLTQDLARLLRCPWESAERLKCEHGSAIPTAELGSVDVEVRAFGANSQKRVSTSHVAEILQARTEEILEMVAIELKRAGYLDRLAAGLVLTGGTSQLPNIEELVEQQLDLPARVGGPRGCTGLTDLIAAPAYSTVVGLAKYALRETTAAQRPAGARKDAPETGFLKRIAAFGRAFIPQ
ncbi:MAG: cell division protein FtsA [Dehalococcoidia bacterium]|nr:cell division protein FtsA [Dehalococcoidia bacterium]HCU99947.1 cell division protein FtsA [Dehalococcoidia bacterium]|tara:strand:- start:5010 stop:6254 length:1245 start_codon:yes stop_codon:yes gene_type:complete